MKKNKKGYANQAVFNYLKNNPTAFPKEIAEATMIPKSTVFDSRAYQLYKNFRDEVKEIVMNTQNN